MIKISEISKKIMLIMTAICLTALGIGAMIIDMNNISHYIWGLLFGLVFSIFKLLLLEKTLNKSVDMTAGNAENYARLHYMMRYFLTGAVLVISALIDIHTMIGVIIAVFSLRPAIFIVNRQINKMD